MFAYTRTLGETTALVLLNFTERVVDFPLKEVRNVEGFKMLLGNYIESAALTPGTVALRGYEGRIYIR